MNPTEEIKQRLDIVELVSESVSLQKAGRNYRALCPFHVEKTPSFFVFPDRQSWHCFGACATGGDIFAFVMKKENLDFPAALRLLAERAGVALPRKGRPAEETQKERLRQANEAAALFFQHGLLNTQAGAAALDYLSMRGIDRETAQAFHLGYSPDSWDALREHLKGRGFAEGELLSAGLLVEGERGLYDRFRHRLMFPIRDEGGRAVGFGSRTLPEESGQTTTDGESPKYLNTPQTPIFDKGAILYALDRAKEHIRRADLAVIVEGYMDVIAAHQHGYGNVVANMGTALTERQLALLRQSTENFVLALDADEAGRMATKKGIQVAAGGSDWQSLSRYRHELGAQIRVIKLPKGQDPDQIIRASPEEWRQLVAKAEPLRIDDPMEEAMQAIAARKRRRSASTGTIEEGEPDTARSEDLCLALLIRHPELRQRGLALSDDLFDVTQNRQVFQAWREAAEEGALRERLPEELHFHLDHILNKDLTAYATQAEKALDHCIGHIEKRKLRLAKAVSSQAIAEKEQQVGAARLAEMARRQWQGEDIPQEEALNASIVVSDMEAGLEQHGRPSESQRGNPGEPPHSVQTDER
jgi:DNA primase catalytic core